jgi:hypothetical protein
MILPAPRGVSVPRALPSYDTGHPSATVARRLSPSFHRDGAVPPTAIATRPTTSPTGPNRPKGATRKITVRRFLAIERSFRGYRPKPAPAPPSHDSDCQPQRAQAVLEALARAYRPGDALSSADIARAAAIPKPDARRIRRFLRGRHQWPYRDKSQRPDGGAP